jgi:hypothetical protein
VELSLPLSVELSLQPASPASRPVASRDTARRLILMMMIPLVVVRR